MFFIKHILNLKDFFYKFSYFTNSYKTILGKMLIKYKISLRILHLRRSILSVLGSFSKLQFSSGNIPKANVVDCSI